MQIELPSQAVAYFNKEAEELLKLLHLLTPQEPTRQTRESSQTHIFTQVLTEKDITNFHHIGTIDRLGRQRSRFFDTPKGHIGLADERYFKFEEVVERLSTRAEVRELLSRDFVSDSLFEWFEKRHKADLPKSADFVNYLGEKAAQEIKPQKIAIPVSFLVIEKPFRIGNVTFEYYPTQFFDELERLIRQKADAKTTKLDEGIRRIRKRYQGVVFASMSITAETEKSIEIAKTETERALMILRFFSPAAFSPLIPSYLGMMGKVNLPSSYVFVFNERFPIIREAIDEKRECRLFVREQDLQTFMGHGLRQAGELIVKRNRTHLEDLLMKCLLFFSRGLTEAQFQDKLVFVLVSIETLLLHDTSEPIQSSVGLRLAHLCGSSVEDRRQIIKLIKDAYKLRSDYLHHGYSKSDLELLQVLQQTVWTALRNVLMSTDRFCSQEELITFLESQILS
jgi:hypothetical protein